MSSSSIRANVVAAHVIAAAVVEELFEGETRFDFPSDSIEADFSYAYSFRGSGQGSTARCTVRNGRGANHSLEVDGFKLSTLALERTEGADLYDVKQCSEVLYPLAEEVLRREFPDASKVFVFDHVTRNASRASAERGSGSKTSMLADGYVAQVHGDYTVRSGFSRARQLFESHETPERMEQALRGRFAFVNVWVPLATVKRDPLGLLQWNSQRPQDVRTIRLVFPHRVGEVYRVAHSPAHRWVYYPEMERGECLVFKVFDSATDGRARFSLHSAFEDPTSPPDAPARASVELRCVLFFDELPESFASGFVAPHLAEGSADRLDVSPERVEIAPASDEW